MVKPRLIFSLLIENGSFMLSRNFSLQRVGDLSWLKEYYDFDSIALSIDELIVLDVTRGKKDGALFTKRVAELVSNCFMPIAAGGGVTTIEMAYQLFDVGADKLVVNTALISDPLFVRDLLKVFGGQSIIASIDYRPVNGIYHVFTENGTKDTGKTLKEIAEYVTHLGVGEIFLTSIQRDGTGQGYDIETLRLFSGLVPMQVIASGGVGSPTHLLEGLRDGYVHAVSTANLFNFMADGLTDARVHLKENGIPLPEWSRLALSTK